MYKRGVFGLLPFSHAFHIRNSLGYFVKTFTSERRVIYMQKPYVVVNSVQLASLQSSWRVQREFLNPNLYRFLYGIKQIHLFCSSPPFLLTFCLWSLVRVCHCHSLCSPLSLFVASPLHGGMRLTMFVIIVFVPIVHHTTTCVVVRCRLMWSRSTKIFLSWPSGKITLDMFGLVVLCKDFCFFLIFNWKWELEQARD